MLKVYISDYPSIDRERAALAHPREVLRTHKGSFETTFHAHRIRWCFAFEPLTIEPENGVVAHQEIKVPRLNPEDEGKVLKDAGANNEQLMRRILVWQPEKRAIASEIPG
jgi:hypothetical protein